ncbi:hypothetical protein A3K29_04135 [Candidatus Collierbacteria bacterium RIFOXYB2_FULL_46_14]|nr:MAG: hypothetical protein A3K29_04135 [Candidatus Collierbacteria bacterium RIFOXYB2_FULL_46_14]OGD76335.1 MAG: hypothetical protein A3K43_04135 [Candidatus Collierbacteria bacterium RIFOXYA2_FULL_46_20]OGD77671.1 MAG: hypothetical protein A3K39_04135 [Candidatus Collierbacteria bacterium RIFOXYC2_FULL_43_15]OGD80961.1 MAG: hypothetical protein A2320_04630 [Pseudomonadales bacterium GWC2_63_15]OGD82393.1 MAG: hypothetical protein A3K36_04135 [Candidatus Collierbacteria bacterium RIFOXYD2_FUL
MIALASGFYSVKTVRDLESVNKLKVEVVRQEANMIKLDDLSREMPRLSNEAVRYSNTLPADEYEVANFTAVVERFAKESGLTISNHFDDFPKQVDIAGKNMLGLGMEITLEGSFQGLTSFFSKLSSMQYFFKVDKITILKHEVKTGVKAIVNGSLIMGVEKK